MSKMIDNIIYGKVMFFDKNPSGRIINRFSNDFSIMDDIYYFIFIDLFDFVIILVGVVFTVIYL